MSAAVLLHDEDRRVLLVKPSYDAPGWELPGSAVGPHESPWDAAIRGIAATLGWPVQLERLLVVDYARPHDERFEEIVFVFDAGRLADSDQGQMYFVDGETLAVGMHTVDEARPKVTQPVADRVSSALAALDKGATVVCERGIPKV